MPTVRDMMNANVVLTKLATNPNVYVTASFKLLPILEFVTEEVVKYENVKDLIVAEDIPLDAKELKLNEYLDSEIELPDVHVGINSLRNCGLTMIDIKHISWWLVEFEAEYEDE